MYFEFVFLVFVFICYGFINTIGEREIDFGIRKCEDRGNDFSIE